MTVKCQVVGVGFEVSRLVTPLEYEIHRLEVELDIADARQRHIDWQVRGFPTPWGEQ